MQKTNVGQALEKGGIDEPYTIFVPSNEALSNMTAGVLDYLLSPEVEYPTYQWTASASLSQPLSILTFLCTKINR
jgi:hypothetical protein